MHIMLKVRYVRFCFFFFFNLTLPWMWAIFIYNCSRDNECMKITLLLKSLRSFKWTPTFFVWQNSIRCNNFHFMTVWLVTRKCIVVSVTADNNLKEMKLAFHRKVKCWTKTALVNLILRIILNDISTIKFLLFLAMLKALS